VTGSQRHGKRNAVIVAAVVTAAGAVAAAVLTGILGWAKPGPPASQVSVGGDNSGCVINGTNGRCEQPPPKPAPKNGEKPAGAGPWEYAVVGTFNARTGVDSGAAVRKCFVENCGCPTPGKGCRIGVATMNSIAYAVCRHHGGWDADTKENPIWRRPWTTKIKT
jgi:hypothetical protein